MIFALALAISVDHCRGGCEVGVVIRNGVVIGIGIGIGIGMAMAMGAFVEKVADQSVATVCGVFAVGD